MTTETSPLRHVNQVLALHGAVFVEAIYRELLGREPDPQGAAYYLSRLQYEQDKTAIVCDFAMSPEGRARIQGLDGLNELVALRDSSRGRLRRFLNKFSRIERSSIRLEWGIAALRQELLSEVHAEQAKIDAALATLRDLSAHIDNRFSDCSSKIDSSYENICRELSRISHVQQETSEQLSRYEELRQLDSEMQIRRTARGSDRQGHHSAGFSGTGVASYALNMGEQANVRLTLNDLLMLAQNARKPRA